MGGEGLFVQISVVETPAGARSLARPIIPGLGTRLRGIEARQGSLCWLPAPGASREGGRSSPRRLSRLGTNTDIWKQTDNEFVANRESTDN